MTVHELTTSTRVHEVVGTGVFLASASVAVWMGTSVEALRETLLAPFLVSYALAVGIVLVCSLVGRARGERRA